MSVKRKLPRSLRAQLAVNFLMDRNALKAGLLHRIDQVLEEKGIAAATASRLAGKSVTFIRDLRTKPDVLPGVDSVMALAEALQISPAWLAYGVGDTSFSVKGGAIPLAGAVSGGVWRDVDSLDQDEKPLSPFLPDPRWPADRQFALRVEGESINRIARDGDLIAVVAIEALDKPPANGALVIVEEARDDGALIRTTAKRLHARGKLTELHADSDDPRWRDVRLIIEPDTDDARLISTRIVGLVTAVHKALA